MSVEEKVRAALQERAKRVVVRGDDSVGPEPRIEEPPRGSGRMTVIVVGLALGLVSGVIVWKALGSVHGTRIAGDDEGNYVVANLTMSEQPSQGAASDPWGQVTLSGAVSWANETFPGVRVCDYVVLGVDGATVGTGSELMFALSPTNPPHRLGPSIPVSHQPVSASATCRSERIDRVQPYDVTRIDIVDIMGGSPAVEFEVRWPQDMSDEDWVTPQGCTATVNDTDGAIVATGTSSIASPVFGRSSTFQIPVTIAYAKPVRPDDLVAQVACHPWSIEDVQALVTQSPVGPT